MNKIDIKNILNEALTVQQKKLVDNWTASNKISNHGLDDSTHDDLFERFNKDKNSSRIIIPLKSQHAQYNHEVAAHIHTNGGWTVDDYEKGTAVRKMTTKRGHAKVEKKSIAKILSETGGDEKMSTTVESGVTKQRSLLHIFNNDPIRKGGTKSGMQVVISRDPYDIGGMTSGRSWESSCMRLPHGRNKTSGGEYYDSIKDDLAHKTLAAYLTHSGDNDIKSPLSRVLLKRHTNSEGHDIWRPETKVYGDKNDAFSDTVDDFAEKEFPAVNGHTYKKNADLYHDDEDARKANIVGKTYTRTTPIEDVLKKYKLKGTVKSKSTNVLGHLHSENGEPSLVIHTNTGKHSFWHNHGELHNDNGPAYTYEENHDNGNVAHRGELHFKNGELHSSNEIPSIKRESFDESGTPTNVEQSFHKFGRLHNGTMAGFASAAIGKNSISISKKVYGVDHTDNDEPSHYTRVSMDGENLDNEHYVWHNNGKVVRTKRLTYDLDGDNQVLHSHEEHNHDAKEGEVISHVWHRDGTGTISKMLGNGHKVDIDYKHHSPSSNPPEESIISTNYRNEHDQPIANPNKKEASVVVNKPNHVATKFYDDQGKLHNENGPAVDETERDGEGNIKRLMYSRNIHGDYDTKNTSNGDILHHSYTAHNDTGKLVRKIDEHTVEETNYTGGVDGHKKKSNIVSIHYRTPSGNSTVNPSGEPSIITKSGFTYTDSHGNVSSNLEGVPASGNIVGKGKKQIGKDIDIFNAPLKGRKVSVTHGLNESGVVHVVSESDGGKIIHHYKNGIYNGSDIHLNDSGKLKSDKDGNITDGDGYPISPRSERAIEKSHSDDHAIMTGKLPLSHITDQIKMPNKISV